MGKAAKKKEGNRNSAGGEKEKGTSSKKNQKDGNNNKLKKKSRSADLSKKHSTDKLKKKNAESMGKTQNRNSISKENAITRKSTKKDGHKSIYAREEAEKNMKRNDNSCFLCFCCGGNEDEELNELLLQQEKCMEEARIRREEEKKRKENEEKKKRKEEEKRKQEEMKKREEEKKRLKMEAIIKKEEEEEAQKKTVLKKMEAKAKPQRKRAQIVFTTSVAAPPPPPASACEGPPPSVKETTVPVGQGAYLVYNPENNGQLEVKYSKQAMSGSGVLAYIATDKIPAFYFTKNDGIEVLLKDVSILLQSEYISDRMKYYEKWGDFLKMQKPFEGTFYLLPAFNANPPAMIDIIFLYSQEKKLQHAPVETATELKGDYTFIIQRGLEVFKKEVNVDALVTFVGSFGYVIHN